MAKQTVCFSITGEFVTEHARDKYRESKDARDGVEFLMRSLPGMSEDIALNIVLGKKKLVGKDDLYLEDDNTEVIPKLKSREPDYVACGWISPEGKIYGYPSYNARDDHDNLAREICNSGYVEMDPLRKSGPMTCYIAVEEAGYVKFTLKECKASCKPAMVSDAQKHALIEIMIAHNVLDIQLGAGKKFSLTQISNMDTLMFGNNISDI